jgi:hypothetical protein
MVGSTVLVVNSRPVIFKDLEQTDRLVFPPLCVAEADNVWILMSGAFIDSNDCLVYDQFR